MSSGFSLPHLHASGSHYQVAYQTGKEFKSRIHEYFKIHENISKSILPFIATEKGKQICKEYHDAISRQYPWYLDEIRGLSDGCGLPFDQIFAINLRVEILHLTNTKQDTCQVIDESPFEENVQECSGFFLINRDHTVMVHNEDSSRDCYHTGYLVSAKIQGKDYENGLRAPDEEFTCHCYPAQIPGNAYGFNSSGFTFTVNALAPKQIALGRLPRQFLTRVMLSCRTLMELEDVFLKSPVAYGVCVNIGYFGNEAVLKTKFIKNIYEVDSPDAHLSQNQITGEHETPIVFSYEVGPSALNKKINRLSKHCLVSSEAHSRVRSSDTDESAFEPSMFSANQYFHFNHFERIKMEECVINSSRNRGIRSAEYLQEKGTIKTAHELLVLASDTKNTEYPIFRSIGTSAVHPIATALFDLKSRVLSIYVDKPTDSEVFLKVIMDYKPLVN